ncbi:MAG: hypothetical protein HFJ79_03635 [Clostridiales bacterium]|nr:hypothetical protein [Clostridiales bacterium]
MTEIIKRTDNFHCGNAISTQPKAAVSSRRPNKKRQALACLFLLVHVYAGGKRRPLRRNDPHRSTRRPVKVINMTAQPSRLTIFLATDNAPIIFIAFLYCGKKSNILKLINFFYCDGLMM